MADSAVSSGVPPFGISGWCARPGRVYPAASGKSSLSQYIRKVPAMLLPQLVQKRKQKNQRKSAPPLSQNAAKKSATCERARAQQPPRPPPERRPAAAAAGLAGGARSADQRPGLAPGRGRCAHFISRRPNHARL